MIDAAMPPTGKDLEMNGSQKKKKKNLEKLLAWVQRLSVPKGDRERMHNSQRKFTDLIDGIATRVIPRGADQLNMVDYPKSMVSSSFKSCHTQKIRHLIIFGIRFTFGGFSAWVKFWHQWPHCLSGHLANEVGDTIKRASVAYRQRLITVARVV